MNEKKTISNFSLFIYALYEAYKDEVFKISLDRNIDKARRAENYARAHEIDSFK